MRMVGSLNLLAAICLELRLREIVSVFNSLANPAISNGECARCFDSCKRFVE